jgi:hypothetical protein
MAFLDSILGTVQIPKFERVDLNQLQTLARQTALDNIKAAKATEQQFNPDLAESRAVLQQQTNALLKLGGAEKATKRILDDFDLGGRLPVELQNQIIASSGARAASSGGPLGALTARDLGQSALALRDKRTQDLLSSYAARAGQAATVQAANPEPVVGLDPGQLASVAVADTNALNNYNQMAAQIRAQNNQNRMQAITSTIGTVGGILGNIFGKKDGSGGSGGFKFNLFG